MFNSNFTINLKINSTDNKFTLMIIFLSLGIILQAGAGSWDATSHLLKKPDTFFTPPHILLYSGIILTLISFILAVYIFTKKSSALNKTSKNSLKLLILGTIFLVGGAPFDFTWHRIFGNDGLLSPPHLTLLTGMLMQNLGGLLGAYSLYKNSTQSQRFMKIVMIPLFSTLLYVSTWYVYFFTLPFSKGHSLNFNPDPLVAVMISLICIPFVTSMIYTTIFKFYKKTGAISLISAIVMTINILGSILPARSFLYSPFIILFYIIASIIPIIIADYFENYGNISSFEKIKKRNTIFILLGGFIIGSSLYIFNFPMLTVVFSKFFGFPLTIGDIADNFFLTILPSYSFIYSIIASSIFAGFMGLAGSYVIVKSKIFS
ncbi:MAG: hypothetical protein ACTHKJ_09865 [Candidatus Nitrosocosmicus sp.]